MRKYILQRYQRYLRHIDYDNYRECWVIHLNSGRSIQISAQMSRYGYGDAIENMGRLIEDYIDRDNRERPMRAQDAMMYRNMMNEIKDFKFEPGMFMDIDPNSMSNVESSKCKSCKGREHGKLDRKGRCTITAKEDFQKTIRRLSLYRQMKNKQVVSAS